jgi:Fe-S cluster assembly protein SufD
MERVLSQDVVAQAELAAPAGLTAAALEDLIRRYGETDYLRDLRLAAWAAYQRIPMPSNRDEEWLRTDIRQLRLDSFVAPQLDGRGEEPAGLRALLANSDALAGLLVQRNGAESARSLDDALAEKGVVYGTIESVAREHPDLIASYVARSVPVDEEKFVALATAFRTGGSFLYVPKNVTVDLPIRSVNWGDQAGVPLCPRTVIVAESGADVTYIDDYASVGLGHPDTGQGFSSSVVEIVAGPGARVRYFSLQEWDPSVWSFSMLRAMADADATVNSLVVALGGRLSKARVQTHLHGRGASAEMLGVLFGTGRQHFDHHTTQEHIAPNTTSELLYKAVLRDQARSVFSGLIKAHKNAQKTDAVQTNRNLLLSPKSRADSIPNLEIEANDLRCTHAAAIAPVDEEQLFYLQARGLARPDAVRLIVEGFFEPLLERIPLPGIRERLRASVEARIE